MYLFPQNCNVRNIELVNTCNQKSYQSYFKLANYCRLKKMLEKWTNVWATPYHELYAVRTIVDGAKDKKSPITPNSFGLLNEMYTRETIDNSG